jgi:hypothetical protein
MLSSGMVDDPGIENKRHFGHWPQKINGVHTHYYQHGLRILIYIWRDTGEKWSNSTTSDKRPDVATGCPSVCGITSIFQNNEDKGRISFQQPYSQSSVAYRFLRNRGVSSPVPFIFNLYFCIFYLIIWSVLLLSLQSHFLNCLISQKKETNFSM